MIPLAGQPLIGFVGISVDLSPFKKAEALVLYSTLVTAMLGPWSKLMVPIKKCLSINGHRINVLNTVLLAIHISFQIIRNRHLKILLPGK